MSFETHKAKFTRTFCAAHRLLNDDSPCHRIHGHNYKAEILVVVQRLSEEGFVIHADRIKEVVDQRFDHRLILHEEDPTLIGEMVPLTGFQEDEGRTRFESAEGMVVRVPFEPTVENLAEEIARDVATQLSRVEQGHGYVEVWLEEVPTISAMARVEW